VGGGLDSRVGLLSVGFAVPVVMTPMIMFSGILYERGSLPLYLSWMENLSIVNYGFAALMSMQVRGCHLTKAPEVTRSRIQVSIYSYPASSEEQRAVTPLLTRNGRSLGACPSVWYPVTPGRLTRDVACL
jgi:hypothetical protein